MIVAALLLLNPVFAAASVDISEYTDRFIGCYKLAALRNQQTTKPNQCLSRCRILKTTFTGFRVVLSAQSGSIECYCGNAVSLAHLIGRELCKADALNVHITCNYGKYGANCGSPCSLCSESYACEITTGGCAYYCPSDRRGRLCNQCLTGWGGDQCDGCLPGYTGSNCQDIDECAAGNDGCSHTCINNVGSYYCQCPTGYQLSRNGGKNCIGASVLLSMDNRLNGYQSHLECHRDLSLSLCYS